MKKYSTETEITDLVRSFEDATISRDDWKHAEHMIVALYYLSHHDVETAYAKMRGGIHNLLVKGFGVDLLKDMPYFDPLENKYRNDLGQYDQPAEVMCVDKQNVDQGKHPNILSAKIETSEQPKRSGREE